MQFIGIVAVILTFTVLTCGAASNNTTVSFPSSDRFKRRVAGELRVYARYAYGLPDRDPWAGRSDPYVSVTAYGDYGGSGQVTLRTGHIQGDHSPHWYQWLYFGRRSDWHHFDMSVWDSDHNADDRLTGTHRVNVRAGYHSSSYSCGSSCRVYYDYVIYT